jgi:V/A-type H+/Na+-transporting ATPase subunit D
MSEQLVPTRMELMRVKEKLALAKRSHKLLKQKRDALIMEFFEIYKKASDLRNKLNFKLGQAYEQMALVQLMHGPVFLNVVGYGLDNPYVLEVTERNVMGVRIPNLELEKTIKENKINNYSLTSTDYSTDLVIRDFSEVLDMVLDLAETENALKRIIREVEKTKRRVNALEYNLMPKLEDDAKFIRLRLEEMERESFFVLKMLKGKSQN